jgi:acyl-CoA reductase-like NAD-dependent aldehyde dehydrogenase
VAGGIVETVTREPLGVVGNISAWNYPYFVGVNVIVPALLAGNAVVYKPSELATLTGRAIAEMAWGSGLPDGLFGLVVGAGDVGAALAAQPLDALCFTGSNATGARVAAAVGSAPGATDRLAGRATMVQLELGGKDPAYVADDVDVAAVAASVAGGAFYNAGQSCCAVERVYVHRSVHDEFVDAFVGEVGRFVVGDPTDPATFIGPLTRAAQLDVLEEQVEEAVARGATVRCGGGRLDLPGGRWFAPTVLTGVDAGMALMRDETFGPVVGVQAVDDDDAAVAAMNDTAFGLTASVYTPDEGRARAVLAQLDTGSAYWNCSDRVSVRLPWSGRRGSGVGVTLGEDGIRAFTRPRAWHLRHRS